MPPLRLRGDCTRSSRARADSTTSTGNSQAGVVHQAESTVGGSPTEMALRNPIEHLRSHRPVMPWHAVLAGSGAE
jgi:hypothetical protein